MPNSKVKLRKVRLSYVHFSSPASFENAGDKRNYQCDVLIKKDDTANLEAVKAGIKEAVDFGYAGKRFTEDSVRKAKAANRWSGCLKDGDVQHPDDEVYQGCYYITVKFGADRQPGPDYYNSHKQQVAIDDPEFDDIFYSGVYANIIVVFYPYSVSGNIGVSAVYYDVISYEQGDKIGGERINPFAEDDIEPRKEETSSDNIEDWF